VIQKPWAEQPIFNWNCSREAFVWPESPDSSKFPGRRPLTFRSDGYKPELPGKHGDARSSLR
jgi:hypothetical protein